MAPPKQFSTQPSSFSWSFSCHRVVVFNSRFHEKFFGLFNWNTQCLALFSNICKYIRVVMHSYFLLVVRLNFMAGRSLRFVFLPDDGRFSTSLLSGFNWFDAKFCVYFPFCFFCLLSAPSHAQSFYQISESPIVSNLTSFVSRSKFGFAIHLGC